MECVEDDIVEALSRQINNTIFEPEVYISHPGVRYEPEEQPWLSVSHHFSPPVQMEYGETGRNRYTGYMSVGVYTLEGEGIRTGLRLAAQVASAFKRFTQLTYNDRVVNIDVQPAVSDPVEANGWIQIPVTVRWRSDNNPIS